MELEAFREREDAQWNRDVDLSVIAGIMTNPPKNLDVTQFYRGKASSENKTPEQLGRELYVKLQNFSDRFRK